MVSGKEDLLLINKWIVFILVSTPLFCHGSNLVEIWDNNQAVDFLNQDKKMEAHEEFTKLLTDQPFNPLYQFNTGVSFLGVEEVDKSIAMNEEVIKNPVAPPEILFASKFNLGVLFSSKKEIDKALEYYQKALEHNPTSKEIKTNIELLIQQQGGKGKGDGENKDKNKDENQDENSEDGEQPKEPQKFQNQPKQFNSQEMSKSDVNKILEELKKQEQQIRAKHERKGDKEADNAKNW